MDRGADLSRYSQYPGEKEVLFTPRSFLEPVGNFDLRLTEKGVVQVMSMKVNANLKAVTIEEYEQRKKQLHMASFKVQMEDLLVQLNQVSESVLSFY